MSLHHYQDALAALLTDAALRETFVRDPGALRERYALDERELRSLSTIAVPPMLQHADLLAQARVMLALKALPATARLLGGAVNRAVQPFCAAYPPEPGAEPALQLEARRFAAFLRSDAARPLGLAPYLGEVAAYEAALFEHGGSPAAWRDATAFAAENAARGEVGADAFARLAPARGAHVRLERFAFDAPALAAAAERGEALGAAAGSGACTILFVKAPGRRTPETLRVNDDVSALLGRCDGFATGAEIAGALGAEAARRGAPSDQLAAVHRACEALRRKNVLAYRAPAARTEPPEVRA
jgi:hypothetical protein